LGHDVDIALPTFTFGLVVVLLVIHYANEFVDYETDSLTRRTPFSGGSGAQPESGLTPGMALKAAWLALIVGSVLGTLGMFLRLLSPTALAVLVWGACCGWMYALRPLALAWRGWGELDNAMLDGVALPVVLTLSRQVPSLPGWC